MNNHNDKNMIFELKLYENESKEGKIPSFKHKMAA